MVFEGFQGFSIGTDGLSRFGIFATNQDAPMVFEHFRDLPGISEDLPIRGCLIANRTFSTVSRTPSNSPGFPRVSKNSP